MLLKTNNEEEIAQKIESALEEYEAEYITNEEIKMKICYPKSEFTLQTEIFLFNQKINKDINYVMTKKRKQTEDITAMNNIITISEVDENFITIFEKIQMFNLRQIYTFELKKYKIGDISVKYGCIYKEVLNKIFFFEIETPFTKTFDASKDFLFDIVNNIFPLCSLDNIKESCLLNEEILKENEVSKNSKHLELFQYVNYIFQKKI